MESIIKWAGGKESELKYILPNSPNLINNYYEPFVGGGVVFVSYNANNYYINDKSKELIDLYKNIASYDKEFYEWLTIIIVSWKAMSNFVKIRENIKKEYIKYRENKIIDSEFENYFIKLIDKYKTDFDKILSKKILWQRKVLLQEMKRNLISKTKRMKKLENEKGKICEKDILDNIETAFKSALYMYYRKLYNNDEIKEKYSKFYSALFVFIRNYAYSGMFRYNDKGEFNVPYGGIGYNSKNLDKKVEYYKSKDLLDLFKNTKLENLDFEEFLEKYKPKKDDFVFLDPPYDSEFSTYANNEFNRDDQKRLANYLCGKCKAKWMMVIKNTPYIYSLYSNKKLNIKKFDKNYTVSFMNRNDKNAEHLLITNY